MRRIEMGLALGVVALVLGLGAGAQARADEPRKEEPKKAEETRPADKAKGDRPAEKPAAARKPATKPRVYTNEDLDELAPLPQQRRPIAGGEEEAETKPAPAADEKPGPERSPIDAMYDDLARQEARKRALEKAEGEVGATEARIKELEQRALAIRNPLLPRPVLTPEEAEAWEGLTNAERLRRTEDELNAMRRQLEEAKARRDALK